MATPATQPVQESQSINAVPARAPEADGTKQSFFGSVLRTDPQSDARPGQHQLFDKGSDSFASRTDRVRQSLDEGRRAGGRPEGPVCLTTLAAVAEETAKSPEACRLRGAEITDYRAVRREGPKSSRTTREDRPRNPTRRDFKIMNPDGSVDDDGWLA